MVDIAAPGGGQDAPPKLGPPVNWWALTRSERVETLEVVSMFTTELVRRYALSSAVIPPCWFKHESLVQELLALFQYRNQQQFMEIAPPGAPLEFHVQLQVTIHRLTKWTAVSSCTEQVHRESRVAAWANPGSLPSEDYLAALESHSAALLHSSATETAGAETDVSEL